MKIKCDFCGNMIDETSEHCPQCGAALSGVNRFASGVPKTIEELKKWYSDRGLPPENVTRFFIGKDIKEIYEIDDVVFEVDNKSLTNRPDLWGHYGIAREIAALSGRELRPLPVQDLSVYDDLPEVPISIEDPELCYRYSGMTFGHVTRN